MPRPRLQAYELALIAVPTALVLGGAAFLARQQSLREQDRSGPYRAQITRVDVLPASPFEVWQGFDTKIIVYVNDAGQLRAPGGARLADIRKVAQKVVLSGVVDGRPKTISVTSEDFGNGYEPQHPGSLRVLLLPRSPELKGSVTFLAKTSLFDPGTPVSLSGKLWFRRFAATQRLTTSASSGWTAEKSAAWNLEARSRPAFLSQALERSKGANVSQQAPPVQSAKADLLSPVFAHTGVVGDNGSANVQITFAPNALSNRLPLIRSTAAQVFDARGRVVELKDGGGHTIHKTVDWDPNSLAKAVVRLPVENVPLERGRLTMKVWFAFEDGWPALVESEVRPAWVSNRARTLQLQSVRVQKGSVIVDARYTGKAALRFAGPGPFHGKMQPVFFDQRDDTSLQLIPNVTYKRLYSHWSQHYVLPNGKSYWFPNNARVQSVNCDASNQCRIVYITNALDALKPGQNARFFAQIGIQGDGFLPIRTIITSPKK